MRKIIILVYGNICHERAATLWAVMSQMVTGQTLSGMTCNRDAKAVRADEVRVGVWR
jgi:hypothetical protein